MQGEIVVRRIAEQRILGDVAIEAILSSDVAKPIPASAAIEVAAGEGRAANDCLTSSAEGNDGVLEGHGGGAAVNAASACVCVIARDRAVGQCDRAFFPAPDGASSNMK
ncbi:MAG: hypothetical protein KAY32_13900 [Candidatus Eisenbacteria sp.]|nr:hypothetical protein [Candidatus Eisenbacteria bacterium]